MTLDDVIVIASVLGSIVFVRLFSAELLQRHLRDYEVQGFNRYV